MVKRKFLRACLFFCFFLVYTLRVFSQVIPAMEFNNAEITDIFLALSNAAKISIIPDDTIKGTATYFFVEMEFEKALDIFLHTYKMYYQKKDNVYYVSRIRVDYDAQKKTVSMDAEDVEIKYLVDAAAKAMNKTIHYDTLPKANLTVHAKDLTPDKFLAMLLVRFPDYELQANADFLFIKKLQTEGTVGGTIGRGRGLTFKNNLYSLNVDKIRFRDLLNDLFAKAGFEFSNLTRKDQMLEDLKFTDKSFEELLRLILDQMSMDYQLVGKVYYLYEISQRDILKKLNTTVFIPLSYISLKEFQKLLPTDLSSSKLYKFDESNNTIILSGSLEEIGPIQKFISQIDRENKNLNYIRYTLNYIAVKDLKALLPETFKYTEPVIIPGTNSFLIQLSKEKKPEFDEYLHAIDRKPDARYVRLKYIKTEDLLKTLPPSVNKEDIVETGSPSSIFFKGSDEKYLAFKKELDFIDRPQPQIQYKLLVIEYTFGDSSEWSSKIDVSEKKSDDYQYAVEGQLGELLNLSFDIVSTFGYQFSAQLNMSLSNKKARIFADTTLSGISGQQVKFQNTHTTRHEVKQEAETDTGTATVTTLMVEVTFGLILNVKGWVSGNGMITMDVGATVSDQTSGTSSETGLPPTSEKVVNTQVRTESGKPIVISGLISQKVDQSIYKTPILGDIPLIGLLFQKAMDNINNTEMVIYIVPHVIYDYDTDIGLSSNLERMYAKYMKPIVNSAAF
jgi:general secretion pathway protein D